MEASHPSRWGPPFLLVVALIGAVVWVMAYRAALDTLAERGRGELVLSSDRLTAQLLRFRELAVVLAEHPVLAAQLDGVPDRAAAEAVLREMADKTGARVLELTDRNGRVVAASQPLHARRDPARPPLARALTGAIGRTNTIEAGSDGSPRRLFSFAAPVFTGPGPARGAVVAELDIAPFEHDWPTTAAAVFFSDRAGRVVVANRSDLVLTSRREPELFPRHRISDWTGHAIWRLDGDPYLPARALHLRREVLLVGLTAELLIGTTAAEKSAGLQAAVAVAVMLVFGGLVFLVGERRRAMAGLLALEAEAKLRLEEQVARRTRALTDANEELTREVRERKEAEAALKRTQAELVRAGRLSALGQMSAGISHELNQPLMAIGTFAENARAYLERGQSGQAGENLGRIGELARRMGRIIKNLRAFARQESEPVADVDLAGVVDTALEMLAGKLGRAGISVTWERPLAPALVRGGEVRLVQVVVNLISNAADAMAASTDRHIEIAIAEAGARLLLSVRDTGPGIAEPERVFDPFYSTKEVGAGEGLGLGLSISYGLVQSFGGNIRGRNHPGGGAEFTVELDRAGLEAAA